MRNKKIKNAVILAGGYGTRMVTIAINDTIHKIPKVLFMVQGTSVLEHIIQNFYNFGVKNIIIATFYLSQNIDSFLKKHTWNINIKIVKEKEKMDTAGAIKYAVYNSDIIKDDFFLINGDTLCSANLDSLNNFYNKKKRTIMVLSPSKDLRNRVVEINKNYKILKTTLYPKRDLKKCILLKDKFLVNAGLYIIKFSDLNYISETPAPIDGFIKKLTELGKIFSFPTNSQYFNIGTPEELLKAENNWKGIYNHKLLNYKKLKIYKDK